jgi:glycosyltransferase involved in cell wall biosynthesis
MTTESHTSSRDATCQSRVPISVVVLAYNEECNISYALDSVGWSDNVLVIDSYSTDRTKEICDRYANVTFVQHRFKDLASQRQFAVNSGLIQHDWVLALDADEYVTPELRDELIAIACSYTQGSPVAYDIAMRIMMWGKWLRYSGEYPVYWRRFFRPEHSEYVQRGHADTLDVKGPIGRTQHDLIHHDRKGLSDWLAKHNRYTSQEAEYAMTELSRTPFSALLSSDRLTRRRAVKRLFRALPCNSFLRFFYLYVCRAGFLDGIAGYEFCRLRAHQHFVIHLKIKELQIASKINGPVTASVESVRDTEAGASI